ncbi:MAG TPA: hypothetical protein EYP34_14555 [Chromatiaceae bacterium]|nr:hypothetical protein [Chromatiaceae bacterium]
MKRTTLDCPNMIVALYEELLSHSGYGDIHISVRNGQGKKKEVRIHCGTEHCFMVERLQRKKGERTLKVVRAGYGERPVYTGPERRSGTDRRRKGERRKVGDRPRSFRLEQRKGGDRRRGKGRRWDD